MNQKPYMKQLGKLNIAMNNIFNKLLNKYVIVFIEIILIYSKSKKEHEEQLRIVLQILREHRFHAKFTKCDFLRGA